MNSKPAIASSKALSAASQANLNRHQGKANVLFCESHVELTTLKFLFADTSDEALSRWNRDHLPPREKLCLEDKSPAR